ncbi:MAG: glycosyltransferase family 2 protein [Syntrophorhabdaceae bacterium]|nr:glycosyltransferase family 2 protein [Syntrophorhabdaceae bacterium]
MDRIPSLSVVIIAKNEEACIGRCVESVAFAGEVVVVDSGSADRTMEIAEAAGARVVHALWPGDYSVQRNRADEHARGEWVFQIDADETASMELAEEIAGFFASGLDRSNAAARIPRKEIIFGKWLRYGNFSANLLRLYRKGAGAWHGKVHEHYVTDRAVYAFANHIVHDSYESIHAFVEKYNRYSSIDAEQEFAKGKPFRLYKLFFAPLERFFGRFVIHAGFRDGFHGFVAAAMIGLNYFLRYLKLWEKQYKAAARKAKDFP